MRIKWVVLVAISFIMVGCAPQSYIQKNTGEVDIFNSFDEVGKSYKKVAELKVKSHRPPNAKNRNKMIQSLRSKTNKVGAEGIVIIDEGHFFERARLPGMPGSTLDTSFIKGIAIVYE
ncbi:MAG: hypothetical protein KJO34_06690 [Deltaproteobacteria bacterium]|nr:hypothetical protein [Deltaproteobacteria bacterium]